MYNYLYEKVDVVKEVDNVLSLDDNLEEDCISLYDVSLLYKDMYAKYESMKRNNYHKLATAYYSRCSSPCDLERFFFNYINHELVIELSLFGEMHVGKVNDDLCVVKPFKNSIMTNEFFSNLFDVLIENYNDFMKYDSFFNQRIINIRIEDSNFLARIGDWCLSIYTSSDFYMISRDFELSSLNESDEYLYDCNSSKILSSMKGREEEIFKHLYVKINKCPEWCRDDLTKIRENQLNIIRKKQKRKEMIKKILPFYKKK